MRECHRTVKLSLNICVNVIIKQVLDVLGFHGSIWYTTMKFQQHQQSMYL